MLPAHLKPWAQLLRNEWPINAGSLPDAQAVAQALELGAPVGAKVGLEVNFVSWEGNSPITVRWRLEERIPPSLRAIFEVQV